MPQAFKEDLFDRSEEQPLGTEEPNYSFKEIMKTERSKIFSEVQEKSDLRCIKIGNVILRGPAVRSHFSVSCFVSCSDFLLNQ